VIQEDIRQGERVRVYTLEALVDGKWQRIADGSCIGHKRIHKIQPSDAKKIRLTISKSVAEPQIKSMVVYNSEALTK
jgi:hypothetical protein